MSKFELLKSQFLNSQNTSEGFKCICPLHNDKDPSLWITEKDCFPVGDCKAGCNSKNINKIIYDKAIEVGYEKLSKKEPIATFQYTDENGKNTFQKLKFAKGSSRPYLIWPTGMEPTLYNLHNVVKADTVFIVEGEKDAETLIKHGVVATTNRDGAGEKWRESYTTALKGKTVYIIPDNDLPGLKHSLKIKENIKTAKIITLPFPKFAEKGNNDISDWLQHNSFDDFLRLLDAPATVDEIASDIIKYSKKETSSSNKPRASFVVSDDFANSCHGLVGDIAKWITKYSKYPQPALALGAALCCVGTIKAKKVCFGTNNLRTNLYVLAFAPSAGGKGIAIKGVQKIFQYLNLDCQCGKLVSDSGLVNEIASKQGRAFLAWDEIGEALQHMASEKANTHYRKIATELTELFSAADSRYYGKQYASLERKDIEQPCLNVFGATNITSFIDSLSSNQFSNGFLPRFLPIQVEVERKRPLEDIYLPDPPEDILFRCQEILKIETNLLSEEPLKIFPTEEAAKRLREVELEFADRIIALDGDGVINKSVAAILGRGYEHVCKVALVLSNKSITLQDVNFAHKLVLQCVNALIDLAIEEAPQDAVTRQINQVYEYIKAGGEKGRRRNKAMYRCCSPVLREAKEVKSVLTTLEDQGIIIPHPIDKNCWVATS